MKILFITTTFPYPPNDGERVRSYNLLRHLSKRNEMTVLAFFDEETDLEGISHLRDLGIEVLPFVRPKISKSAFIRSLLLMQPLFVYGNYSVEFSDMIGRLAKKSLFDVVHLDGLPMVQYFSQISPELKVVFDLRDSWSVLYKRNVFNSSWACKLFNILKYIAVRRYENYALNLPLKVVLLSAEDKKALEHGSRVISDKINLIPNGIDTEYFHPNNEVEDNESYNVVFTGSLAYMPNSEAVEFFVNKIWPYILEELPQARFRVVGKKPSPRLMMLNSGSVEIVGEVQDLRPYVWNAGVVVCPLLSGAGIKNKVLEAMALGKAVIATKIAVEGIPGEDGRHYLVCDDAKSMANAVVRLLQSKELRIALQREALTFVKDTFCWRAAAVAFEKLYAEN